MLAKSFIFPSNLPCAAPVLIVKKLEVSLGVYVDYCALNALTIQNRNSLSLIRKIFAGLLFTKIFSKFDITAAFNEIRIQKRNEEKTAFYKKRELYKYVVMFFVLTLPEFINNFCTTYFNDILIYSENISANIKYIQQVLWKLSAAELFLDICKCDFSVYKIKYLRLINSTMGLKIDYSKVDTIQN